MGMKELTKILLEILQNNYSIASDKLQKENWDTPLIGNHFTLSGFELAALILEFEKRTETMIDIHGKPMYALASINDIIKSFTS